MLPLGPLLEVGSKILDRVLPDQAAADRAKQELAKLHQDGELAKLAHETKLFEAEQANVSDRWKADMASDSWLSKNIRPMTLVYILTAYLALAILDGLKFHVAEAYVTLLGQWGMLVMGAYFGGRTLEKVMVKGKDK